MALMCSMSMVDSSSSAALSRNQAPIQARNASTSRATSSGLVVVQHVAAGPTTWRSTSAHDVQPLVELGLAVALAPPLADVGPVALDPQQRRARSAASTPASRRRWRAAGSIALVGRVAEDARGPAPSSVRAATSAAPARPPGRRAAAGWSCAGARHLVEAGVGAQLRRRLQLVEPLASASAPAAGFESRHAEAFEVDEPAHPLRPHAGVEHHHVAAHAVADQVDRRPRANRRRAVRRGRRGSRRTSSCRPAASRSRPKPRQSARSRRARRPARRRRTGTMRRRPSSHAASPAAAARG